MFQSKHTEELKKEGFLHLFIAKYLIQGAAVSIVGLFTPIFLYIQFGENFALIGLFYFLLSFIYVLCLVPSMSIINRLGIRKSLTLSGLIMVFVYVLLYFISVTGNVTYLVPALLIFSIAYSIFHWVPMHVDLTSFTNHKDRGWQLSLTMATVMFLGIIGPILSGFIISESGYEVLFLIVIALLLCATVAYSLIPNVNIHFDWGWKKTWSSLVSKEMRGMTLAQFANGMETIINIVVWPIFLYTILNGNIFEIGFVSTIVVGVTVVVQLMLGKKLDGALKSREVILKTGSIFYALGWVLKIFILSALHVFLVGLYHNVTKIFVRTPYDTILYEISSDQGSYIDEFSVVREIAFHLGRVSAMLLSILLFTLLGIGWTFLIAATASIALNFIYRKEIGIA